MYQDMEVAFRATSTKTRIETLNQWQTPPRQIRLSERHPPKQGLKHLCELLKRQAFHTFRATSTKTRIETGNDAVCRQEHEDFQSDIHQNKDWNMSSHAALYPSDQPFRATSTKTRIETHSILNTGLLYDSFRATSTKTRIETLKQAGISSRQQSFQSDIHENKDWNSVIWFFING